MLTSPSWNPFEWSSQYWPQLVSLSVLGGILYKMYSAIQSLVGFRDKVNHADDNLSLIITNHLPHLQKEAEKFNMHLTSLNNNLTGLRKDTQELRNDIRVVVERMP